MRPSDLSYRSESYIQKLRGWLWNFMRWLFRIEISGLENIPQGPCLLIANHNSGALLESHSLLFALSEENHKVFGLNHPALFKIPAVSTHFRKIGAVTASREVSKEVLQSGQKLLIFPGGNRQAFRPWSQRHTNSFSWAKGWSEIAIETSAPVVPIKFIGSHSANPILLSSSFLSKILILPWALGVKWFPLSLAQAIFALGALVLGLFSGAPLALTLALTYLAFCLTPLIPVLPSRIHIKIYPPLPPLNKSAADLREEVSELMDRKDYPQGKRVKYPLNGLERFMFLHESEHVRYNSHFVFEFGGTLDKQKILETTNKWTKALPQLRSVIQKGFWQSERYAYSESWFSAKDLVSFEEGISQNRVDEFCNKPFSLHDAAAVRFLVLSQGTSHLVIFSCHHSLFDGAAQAYAFEEWSRLYNGEEVLPKWTKMETFRYRSLRKHMGLWNSTKLLLKNLSMKPPRMQMSVASLATTSELKHRGVCSLTIKLPKHVSLREDFYEKALISLDEALKKSGDKTNPIIAYMPTGLRWTLKVKASLQNILVSHTLFLNRKYFSDGSLKERIIKKLKSDPLIANTKFLFGVLPLCSFGQEKGLKKQFALLDRNDKPTTSTALLVSAPIPKGYVTPRDWKGLYISARGTLLRSPSVGLIFTGKLGFETLTIEYIPGLVTQRSLENLVTALKAQVGNIEESALESLEAHQLT